MKTSDIQTMFIPFACLAILAISAPACEPTPADDSLEIDDVSELDERAAPDAKRPAPPNISALTPDDVYIESISTHGKGCPKDTDSAEVTIASSRQSFLVALTDMLLQNPGAGLLQTTNCVVAVRLHIPGGWQVSVATVNTRGYAFLQQGLKARQISTYFFAGDQVGYSAHTELKGPYDDLYVFTDEIPFQSIVWSPCGTSSIFAINTSLVLNAIGNPSGIGVFNNTTIDGRFQKEPHLQWREC